MKEEPDDCSAPDNHARELLCAGSSVFYYAEQSELRKSKT